MATVPLTDKRQSDFLEGAQFAVCPIICGSNGLDNKKKKGRFTGEAFKFRFVCKPSLIFHLISLSRLFPLPDAF